VPVSSAPAPAPGPPARLDFLDGLRGFAALVVIAHHYSAAFYPTTMTGAPATAHLPGHWEAWFAGSPVHVLLNFRVCFFFVLSGLVLAASTARAPRSWRALPAQLVRRYVRLGVPVAAALVLTYPLLRGHLLYNHALAAATGAAWVGQFWPSVPPVAALGHDALYGVLLAGHTQLNPVLWTMVVEWYGSVLVLGLLAAVGTRAWRLWLYAGLALAITLYRSLDFYYVGFLLGLGLYDLYQRGWAARFTTPQRRLLIVGLLLAALFFTSYPQSYYSAPASRVYTWMYLPGVGSGRTADMYYTLGAALLLGAVLLSARLRRLTMQPFLRRVGKRAFSLYLLHFVVLSSGSAGLFLWLRGQYSYHASFGLMLLPTVLVLWSSAELFYRWVDVPSHTLARWLGRAVAARLAPARRATLAPPQRDEAVSQ